MADYAPASEMRGKRFRLAHDARRAVRAYHLLDDTIIIARTEAICRRATLFGFAKGWRGQNVKYHYYDGYNPTNTQESRDTAEGRRQPEMVDAINLIANADAAWVRWAESVGWAHGKLTFGEDIVRDFPSGF